MANERKQKAPLNDPMKRIGNLDARMSDLLKNAFASPHLEHSPKFGHLPRQTKRSPGGTEEEDQNSEYADGEEPAQKRFRKTGVQVSKSTNKDSFSSHDNTFLGSYPASDLFRGQKAPIPERSALNE